MKSKSEFISAAGVLLALLTCLAASSAIGESPKPPNIIFIMADDLGWGDLECYGQQRIRTPNLDRLAEEGMRFTQVYAGSTVCAPSRSVLMTGQHTGHTRIRGNARHPLLPEDVTAAEMLKTAGYQTGLIGKWGLGEAGTSGIPNRQGFDYFFGYLNQHHAHNYYPTYLWRNQEKVPLKNVVPNEDSAGGGKASVREQYSHDLFAEEAREFVRRHQADRFFLYLALTIPHANNEAGRQGMEVPDYGSYEETGWPEPQKGHAAMITRMDEDIGELLELLEELELAKETLIFFTSDNGPHAEGGNDPQFNDSNGPLRGMKRDLYEGGIRVPMLVWWPERIEAGVVNDTVWYFADVLPTLADLTNTGLPEGVDGRSILPALLGKKQDLGERFLYWEFHVRGFTQAARWGAWKGVRKGLDQPLELYHLTADSGEHYDLSDEYPWVVKRLENYLEEARTPSKHWPLPAEK